MRNTTSSKVISFISAIAYVLLVQACSKENQVTTVGAKPGSTTGGGSATPKGSDSAVAGGATSSQSGSRSEQTGGSNSSQSNVAATSGGGSSTQSSMSPTSGGSSVNPGSSSATRGGSSPSRSGATPSEGGAAVTGSGGAVDPGVGGTTSDLGGSTSTAATDAGQSSVAAGGTSSTRKPTSRPVGDQKDCGNWALTDGVCCAQYCKNDNKSESCSGCGGPGSAECQVVNSKACTSGMWPEVHSLSDNEPWHYSRSTHFGLTASGACAFGLYGLCTTAYKFDGNFATQCDAFCKAYPNLCKDPENITLHGNFTAPQGNYFTQFWPSLSGDNDNYMSCGECFELVRTQKDGTEYKPGDPGYTPPIVIQVYDSCPCAANSKWCCGSGRDHCGEVSDFKYGCQLPPSPPPPLDHDPTTDESVHFDLSDIAMARLQTGSPTGAMVDGVIPTKYRRIPCPVVGNMYFWLQTNANEYYFALSVVNMSKFGAPTAVEARLPSGEWVALKRNANYTMSRPQERYGTWVLPQNSGQFALPVTIRVTDGSGRSVVAEGAIKSWTPSDPALKDMYYVDSGVQF